MEKGHANVDTESVKFERAFRRSSVCCAFLKNDGCDDHGQKQKTNCSHPLILDARHGRGSQALRSITSQWRRTYTRGLESVIIIAEALSSPAALYSLRLRWRRKEAPRRGRTVWFSRLPKGSCVRAYY